MEDIIIGLIVLLLFLLVIVVWIYISSKFASIALDKGYDNNHYFWNVFLLGIIGMLMVIALPDRGNNDKEN